MPAFRSACPNCLHAVRVPDHMLGKIGKCQECGTYLTIKRMDGRTILRAARVNGAADTTLERATAPADPVAVPSNALAFDKEPALEDNFLFGANRRSRYRAIRLRNGLLAFSIVLCLPAGIALIALTLLRRPPRESAQAVVSSPPKTVKRTKKRVRRSPSARSVAAPSQVPTPTPRPVNLRKDDWKKNVRELMHDFRQRFPVWKKEPLPQPDTWTKLEYRLTRGFYARCDNAIKQYGPSALGFGRSTLYWIYHHPELKVIAPHSIVCWEREMCKQVHDDFKIRSKLDGPIPLHPYLRIAKRKWDEMSARLEWREREALYLRLRGITDDERPWSLLHPFDSLNAADMKWCIDTAERASQEGGEFLTKEDVLRLLAAGQDEFLLRLLSR